MFKITLISRIQEEREERHRLKSVVKEQTKVGRPVEPTEPQIRLGGGSGIGIDRQNDRFVFDLFQTYLNNLIFISW